MTESQRCLPACVYRAAQHRFDAISGSPWVYWLRPVVRKAFEYGSTFGGLADVGQGMTTGDNNRFLRRWWELGLAQIGFGLSSSSSAKASGIRWFPYMKGGGRTKWYGHLDWTINWYDDGREVKSTGRATIRNSRRYFKPGITWSSLSSSGFSARLMPAGFLFDDKGSSCGIPAAVTSYALGLLNSTLVSYILSLLNPSLSSQAGDISRIPVFAGQTATSIHTLVLHCIHIAVRSVRADATSCHFVSPPEWRGGTQGCTSSGTDLSRIEVEIDDWICNLYGINDEDRGAIEAELTGGLRSHGVEDSAATSSGADAKAAAETCITREELAIRWISYAVGTVLGRFQPGISGDLGRAIYSREDFAIGSLPSPDEAKFEELVGPTERFAYVDDDGGRHVFPREVEAYLRELSVADGITVLDEGHPRDLPTLVEQALTLMLGSEATQAVIAEGARGNLRKFLQRDFFTKWHLKWYRKRPVYWLLQSARRSFGFVLFHERIDRDILYVLQRDYLDHKLNGLRLEIGDLNAQREGQTGRALKQVEREIDTATQLLDELSSFGETMERLARQGYEPAPNWSDDGVILRMAPLWELIPVWKTEPKKYWERLQQGQYDWSHIAMRYWPDRVREKCVANKSFAIAHGHEEWNEDTG